MRVLACSATTVLLSLPTCGETLTSADITATATREGYTSHTLEFTLTPPANDRVGIELTLTDLERGVWSINVTTPCGCYVTPIYSAACQAPVFPSLHQPTRPVVTPTMENCAPALQPDLAAADPTIGMVFERNADASAIGIALGEHGRLIAPHPALTTVEFTALDGTLPIVGTLAPLPDELDGSTWILEDCDGHTLATGTLAVAGGAGTLSATLVRPLACGNHYLTIATSLPPT